MVHILIEKQLWWHNGRMEVAASSTTVEDKYWIYILAHRATLLACPLFKRIVFILHFPSCFAPGEEIIDQHIFVVEL